MQINNQLYKLVASIVDVGTDISDWIPCSEYAVVTAILLITSMYNSPRKPITSSYDINIVSENGGITIKFIFHAIYSDIIGLTDISLNIPESEIYTKQHYLLIHGTDGSVKYIQNIEKLVDYLYII